MDFVAEMDDLLAQRTEIFEAIRASYSEGRTDPSTPLLLAVPAERARSIVNDLEALKAREIAFLLRLRGT